MAEAADGAPRSEKRRRHTQIRVRMTPEERLRIERNAASQGHATAAAYMRAVALNSTSTSPRERQMVGVMGLIGGWLTEAETVLKRSGRPDAIGIGQRARVIAAFQRQIMEGAHDRETDQDTQ